MMQNRTTLRHYPPDASLHLAGATPVPSLDRAGVEIGKVGGIRGLGQRSIGKLRWENSVYPGGPLGGL